MATRILPGRRAPIGARTLRVDAWWVQPTVTVAVLLAFIVYGMWASFQGRDYLWEPYISPFYSPCIAYSCLPSSSTWPLAGSWYTVSPAWLVLLVPLAFRTTCYYYRKAYYRSFWLSPPACAVAEPHRRYTGETRFPLVLNNIHRYSLYVAALLAGVLTYDAVIAFRSHTGAWGHAGLGTLVLVINAVLIWGYTIGCHACRHVIGGRLNHFSRHPLRYRAWTLVSWFNARHQQFAWASLVWVALADVYVRVVASGMFHDPRFF